MKSHCRKFPSPVSMKRIDEKIMVFELNIGDESNRKISFRKIEILWEIGPNLVPRLNWTPSRMCVGTWLIFQVDFSIHRRCVYKPFWGPTNREKFRRNFSEIFRWCGFVTTPGAFNLNLPKNQYVDDLGKAVMDFPDLMCSDGPGRWLGAQRCLERDLETSRSNLASETVSTGTSTKTGD